MNSYLPRIILTAGEPAGIGPDLCVQMAQSDWGAQLVVAGSPELLEARSRQLGLGLELLPFDETERLPHRAGRLFFVGAALSRAAKCGELDPANATYVLETLDRAARGCLDKTFDAMVTAPVQKSTINEAGISFSGHTEYLAALTDTPVPVMLLIAHPLRVALATTHLRLADVSSSLTPDLLAARLTVLHDGLKRFFKIASPHIAVCGLNPHAGEAGHLGDEEKRTIEPVIRTLRERGLRLTGPIPADTAFTPHRLRGIDAVMAMYHDQGLPVVKYAGFGRAVNLTLGLPIIRTSVDHGTALELAGTGTADAGSMRAALELAIQLVSLAHSERETA